MMRSLLKGRVLKLVAIAFAGILPPAFIVSTANAHHSFAMYDSDRVVAVSGTVKEFKWANPHVVLLIAGVEAGRTEELIYTMEFPAPAQIVRNGWSHDILKTGDRIQAEMHPFKDGKPGGSFMNVTFPDGRKMDR